jgi:hypothetical protein
VPKKILKKERRNKMTEKERQQVLIGLGVWNLELKELGQRAKERKLVFEGRSRAGLLTGFLNRLKRPR